MVSRNTLDHVNTLRRSNLNLTYVDGAYRSIPMDTGIYFQIVLNFCTFQMNTKMNAIRRTAHAVAGDVEVPVDVF